MRASLKSIVVLVAMVAAPVATPAAIAQSPRWFADAAGGAGPRAKWGIPESDAVGFEVLCGGGGVVLRPALFAVEELADPPPIRFTVDGTDFVRDATLTFDEASQAWQAAALVALDDDLITAMRRGTELTYDFDPPLRQGDAFTVSLSGSAKAINAAIRTC